MSIYTSVSAKPIKTVNHHILVESNLAIDMVDTIESMLNNRCILILCLSLLPSSLIKIVINIS